LTEGRLTLSPSGGRTNDLYPAYVYETPFAAMVLQWPGLSFLSQIQIAIQNLFLIWMGCDFAGKGIAKDFIHCVKPEVRKRNQTYLKLDWDAARPKLCGINVRGKKEKERRLKTILLLSSIILFIGCKQLSENMAAQFAASLANKECSRLYKQSPFSPENYKALFEKNRWTWGKLDSAVNLGFSARVSFDKDCNQQKVEIKLTTDNIPPQNPVENEIKSLESK
jgi:hypothetical protein